MREILAFKGRIKPLIDISLKFMVGHDELFGMQDTIVALQYATYYVQEAAEFVYQANKKEGDIEHGGDKLLNMETPSLSIPTEQLQYLFEECNELSRDIFKFMTEVPLGQLAQLWLTNALTKITEAKFSVSITSIQYERLQTIRGTDLPEH
jgi:hypothetical protein